MRGQSTVENWLSRLANKTAKDHGYTFKAWMRWMKENGGDLAELTPDELVAFQEEVVNNARFRILDLIQRYVSSLSGRVSTKTRAYSALRSFFMHNRVELPKDTSFRIRSDTPPVEGTLTIEELKNVVLGAKPVYQAVLLSMFQGGMGVAEFEYWNLNGWPALREALRRDAVVVKCEMPGRKTALNIRPFHTYIGGDAIRAIRDWLRHRPEGAEAIFTNQYRDPITTNAVKLYWKRHLIKLGLIVPKGDGNFGNRYGKNLHEIRDLFRSQWEKSPAKASVAEFMMGHRVDPLLYNKAHRDKAWTRREYRKALPMLEIMSSGRPFGVVDVEEIERLETRLAEVEKAMMEMIQRVESGEPSAHVLNLASERWHRPDLETDLREIAQRVKIGDNYYWVYDVNGKKRLISAREFEKLKKNVEAHGSPSP